MTVYLFLDVNPRTAGQTRVCLAEKQSLEAALGDQGVQRLFHGGIVYVKKIGQTYLGVWGARNASRLRRLLRERGSEVTVQRVRPKNVVLRSALTLRHP